MAVLSVASVTLALAAGAFGFLPPKTDLAIVNRNISPDGFNRSTVLAEGVFPGPLIKAFKGDDFSVNVKDQLVDGSMLKSTSMHWHGIFQQGTTWADGPEGVNQCPIAPGNSFSYDFKQNQAGTFWYHSHHSTQYCDGLRGPLVIYDRNDPHKGLYDIDDESTILTLSDWYHIPAKQEGAISYPDSTLINGRGRYKDGPAVPLTVISVVPTKRYRVRLISMACDPHFLFQIDGHTMTIIEVDGINHKPYQVDSIDILAGQRYSFILKANKPVGNYWIRADPSSASPGFLGAGFDGGRNSAILRYLGAPKVEPTTLQGAIANPFIESKLVPLVAARAPGRPVVDGADININLNVVGDPVAGKFYVNGQTFAPPSVPVLLQIMSGANSAQDLLPSGLIYELPMNKSVQISLPGGALGGPHPMHLHGHAFSVVRSAGQTGYNFDNPPVRDVVSMGGDGDNTTIRFRTDNPGPWFLHCHIDWHLDAGFAVVFAEAMPETKKLKMPQPWVDLCPIWDALPQSEH